MNWPTLLGFKIGPFLRLSEFCKVACVCREWNTACRPMLTRMKAATAYLATEPPVPGVWKRHDLRNYFEPGVTKLRPLFRNLLLLNILRNR
jgi:hypothetical protein